LAEIAALPEIRKSFDQLYSQHLKSIDIIRAHARLDEGVIFFDAADEALEGFNKFIPYYLFPEAVYSVAVSRSRERTKIGVGSNPWNPAPKSANLATICERFGGGGHAKVAAISLPPTDIDRAREVAHQITRELQASLK
jgi:c-di-AMP phosphodiesterase-like protein